MPQRAASEKSDTQRLRDIIKAAICRGRLIRRILQTGCDQAAETTSQAAKADDIGHSAEDAKD